MSSYLQIPPVHRSLAGCPGRGPRLDIWTFHAGSCYLAQQSVVVFAHRSSCRIQSGKEFRQEMCALLVGTLVGARQPFGTTVLPYRIGASVLTAGRGLLRSIWDLLRLGPYARDQPCRQ